MNIRKINILSTGLMLIFLIGITGCSSGLFGSLNEIQKRAERELSSTVKVTGVSLDENTLSLLVGTTGQLQATVSPKKATNKTVIWTSDNEEIAVVVNQDGMVRALTAGIATITASIDGFSDECIVTVVDKVNAQTPNISSPPVGATVSIDTPHTISVTAGVTDGGTLTYQWYSNSSQTNIGGTIIEDEKDLLYEVPTNVTGTFYYFVEITNSISDNGDGGVKTASIRSSAVAITVNTLVNAQIPNITSEPIGTTVVTVVAGSIHTMTINAVSPDSGSITYQWYSNTTESDEDGTAITGATLQFYNAPTDAIGTIYYFVKVTNTIFDNSDGGSKNAFLYSQIVSVNVKPVMAEPPNINIHPAGGARYPQNGTAQPLSVSAVSTDGGILTYQWYWNSTNSNSGGTSLGYFNGAQTENCVPLTTTAGTRYYYVVVTNTITDNGDGGVKTATASSNTADIQVS